MISGKDVYIYVDENNKIKNMPVVP